MRLLIPACLLIISLIPSTSVAQSNFQYKDDVDFTKLQNAVGASLEDGTGMNVSFVEAPDNAGNYLPLMTANNSADFAGKNITAASGASGGSGHSAGVGLRLYGNNFSMTPSLGDSSANPIIGYEANDWINNQLRLGSGVDPLFQNFDVTNHSYAGAVNAATAVELGRRVDYAVNQSGMTMVVGTSNGNLNSTTLPGLHTSAYNVITVGRTDGMHAAGFTTSYGNGRIKPDIVAPEFTTSNSTPIVSSAAVLLRQAGAGTNAVQPETTKAILLAGATKDEFPSWDRTTTRPLDERFGAGELNVYNSYQILQGGEFNGVQGDPATSVGEYGWDYEDIVAGNDLVYEFAVAPNQEFRDLSIVLNWHMNIIDQNNSQFVFDPVESLANMDLRFYDSTNGFLGNLIDSSVSDVDNVEHIFFDQLAAGTYHLVVSSDLATDFGLAWRFTTVPEPGSAGAILIGLACFLSRRKRRS